jgi:hypothetical protein
MSTRQTIIDAIRTRTVLQFTYKGLARTVEPHAVGLSTKGYDALLCFQIAGAHITPGHEWDFCRLDGMSDVKNNERGFSGTRPRFARGDKRMTTIYAEL